MNNSIHLRDYFPDFVGENSLFQKMVAQGAPWNTSIGEAMDRAYFTMYSGIKNPSEFVTLNMAGDVANSITIAAILYSMYGEPWTRLWEAYQTKYVPIDNYNIQETTTRTETDDRIINKNTLSNGSSDGTDTTTYGQNVDTTANAKSYTYGFNSTEKVPTGEQDESGTEANSGSDSISSTSTSESKVVDDTTDTNDIKEDIQRTRTGNVGQNSYQELLRQEFDLWRWNFFTQVFEDVDKFLVLSVYSDCANHINQFSQLN